MWAISIHPTIINSSTAPVDCDTCTVSKVPLFLQKHCPGKFSVYGPAHGYHGMQMAIQSQN